MRYSSLSSEEYAPRRRGTVRISNMNPKNIGLYMEGEGGKRRKGKEYISSGKGQKGEGGGCRQKKGFNEKLRRFWRFGR